MQQLRQLLRWQIAQRPAALPEQFVRQRFERIPTQPRVQFRQRRVQPVVQCHHRDACVRRAVSLPDHVQHHFLERGIAVVPVRAPAGGAQVHFHVALARRLAVNLHHRAAEIRAGVVIFETRMKHPGLSTVQCNELVAPQTLPLPDDLQQLLRRERFMLLPQRLTRAGAGAPAGVEIGGKNGHRPLLLGARPRNVKSVHLPA
jgi:hypothetical protein